MRNGKDGQYQHRPDSNFWYLTGFKGFRSEESVLVVTNDTPPRSIFFTPDVNTPVMLAFCGPVCGVNRTKTEYGFDEAYPSEEIEKKLPEILSGYDTLFYPMFRDETWDKKIFSWTSSARGQNPRKWKPPCSTISDLSVHLGEMRLIKDPDEIKLLRWVARITAEGVHSALLELSKNRNTGFFEYETQSDVEEYFVKHGCKNSFPSIIASGKNACTLHYEDNNSPLLKGDLVLLDVGAEKYCYAGDVSRTFPVSGKFTPAQRKLYDIVLRAQESAIDKMRVGIPYNIPHFASVKVIVEGLISLGLLKGTVEEEMAKGTDPSLPFSESYRRFYMHSVGHWLGLDAHDDCPYFNEDGTPRTFLPGMVMTSEPGLYIKNDADIPVEYRNIGIRIEDDILITEDGPEILSAGCPKDPDEIEKIMSF